jgi:hypothetical protein
MNHDGISGFASKPASDLFSSIARPILAVGRHGKIMRPRGTQRLKQEHGGTTTPALT